MAQLVEHIVHIDGVTGSSPVSTTTSSAELRIFSGALAQLVARLNGIQKVRGSTPLTSTIKRKIERKTANGRLFLF